MCQRNRRLFCYSLIVILLIVVLAACQDEGVPNDVVVSVEETAVSTSTAPPTFTATPTFTPSLTPTQTKTAVPTSTPTRKPASAPIPTTFPTLLLTPNAPDENDQIYRLVSWSPEHANNLALLMEDYYESMSIHLYSGTTKFIYYSTFKYAALAYAEAALRFLNDPQIDYWLLGKMAHQATGGYQFESAKYQDLIVDNLNSDKISLDLLPEWFHQYPYGYDLEITPLVPLPGYISSQVITIYDDNYNGYGNTSFLLVENIGGFQSYSLYSNLGDPSSFSYSWYLADVTGDDISDIIISANFRNGSTWSEESAIFDLSIIPPNQLRFGPEWSWAEIWSRHTEAVEIDGEKSEIHIHGGDIINCPAWYVSIFRWNGQWFEQKAIEIDNEEETYFSLCSLTFGEQDWQRLSEIERVEFLSWFEVEFGDSLLKEANLQTKEVFSNDEQDEFRYMVAMNYTTLGKVVEAQKYLERIINTPSIPESQWIKPAETFLANYESAEDVYRACAAAGVKCSLQLALEQVASTIALDEFDGAIEQLIALGVPVVANGRFDFDNDRNPEHWFIVRHQPGGDYELWILAASDVRVKAMFVDTVGSLNPTLLLHTASYPPANDAFQFTIGNDSIYNFIRRLRDQEPYVTKLHAFEPYSYEPPPEKAALDRAIDDLLSGKDPREIVTQLQTLADTPNFEPDNRYYYYLGLAYELLGEEDNAVNAYLLAWQDCCDTWQLGEEIVTANPYAIMARAKLEPVP